MASGARTLELPSRAQSPLHPAGRQEREIGDAGSSHLLGLDSIAYHLGYIPTVRPRPTPTHLHAFSFSILFIGLRPRPGMLPPQEAS